ncbi:hypothetical protein D3C86_2036340 [compost metagenome]
MLKPGLVPAELIFERLVIKNLLQLRNSVLAEIVLCRLFTLAFVAVGDVGIEVGFVAGIHVAADARKALNLAA